MSHDVQAPVQDFLEQFRAAWDAGDATAYAALFTETATYVIFMGEVMTGREDIRTGHIDVFGRWQKGTRMAVKPLSVQDLGPDTCSVLTIGGIGHTSPIAYDKLQTFTLIREGGRWLCAAFQNTEMSGRAKAHFNG